MKPTLHVNLAAIRHNVRTWRDCLRGRPLWAVVKCDAYRMGMAQIARACVEAGAERLCVVEMREAAALRATGIDVPIVQIAATPEADIETGVRLGVAVSVADAHRAATVSRIARDLRTTATVHVAVETGTGWWGVTPSDARAFAHDAVKLSNIVWEGVWTHIAGRNSMDAQMQRLHEGAEQLRAGGLGVPVMHVGSTGPTVWGLSEGAARIGVGLHGASMGDEIQAAKLQTAFEVRAPIYGIRRFAEPMPLGYGGTYVALPGQTIVTLRIGYGEGMPKSLAGRGSVRLGGVLCSIVGDIGMNFTMVAVPPNVDIAPNEEAIIVADQPGVRLEEVAVSAQTIPHNIVTMFGSSLAPVYTGVDAKAPI